LFVVDTLVDSEVYLVEYRISPVSIDDDDNDKGNDYWLIICGIQQSQNYLSL